MFNLFAKPCLCLLQDIIDALMDWIDHAPEEDQCCDQEPASDILSPEQRSGQRSSVKRRRLTHRASSASLDDVLEIVGSQGSDPPCGDGMSFGTGVVSAAVSEAESDPPCGEAPVWL